LIYDRIKNIELIEYNYLNLPTLIRFKGGGGYVPTIQFVYDATGTKLRKIAKVTSTTSVIYNVTYDYVGGVEYKNNSLERIPNTEGAVTKNTAGVYEYEYVLRDHLGNTRATFSDANNDGIVTSTDIRQINHYYPFGMNMEGNWTPKGANGEGNKYQYNGKELNEDFGLGWNHHDWRFYDVAIDRFVTIDRKSEEDDQKEFSPYHFAKDNPIRYDDPDGQCPTCFAGFVIGFALDVATQVAFEGKSLGEVSYTKAAVAGVAGALSGGISSVVKLSRGASILVNAAIDATESVTKQAIDGKFSGEQLVSDVVMGGIGNEVKIIKESDIKVKENTLNRAERVALGDPKSSGRAQNVVDAKKSVANAKNTNTAGEIQAGNVLQSTSDKVRPLLESPKNNAPLMRPPAQIAQDQTRIIKPLFVKQ
jgi:RHS repeat-associated protein